MARNLRQFGLTCDEIHNIHKCLEVWMLVVLKCLGSSHASTSFALFVLNLRSGLFVSSYNTSEFCLLW